MSTKVIRWLAYTFLVGLIPIATRLLVWSMTEGEMVTPMTATDFVAFGLVLHISLINELEHVSETDNNWKAIQNGTSIFFIVMYSPLYALTLVSEKTENLVADTTVLRSSIAFSLISSLLCFSVFHRLLKLHANE